MVTALGLHKWFGSVHAVRGVDVTLAPGHITGLLGHNGAGKSTTMRMIAGFLTPDAGSVRVDGLDLAHDRAAAALRVGYMPESTPLYPEMRTQDYLHYRARLFGLSFRDRRQAVARVLERCWLRDVRTRRIGALSKGYRQRVGLASALLHDPPTLLLDEPTSGLDPTQVRETRALVRELAQDRAMLISSHVLAEVEVICNRVVIIAGGRVRADGPIHELARAGGGERCTLEARTSTENGRALLTEHLGKAAGVARVGVLPAIDDGAWSVCTLHLDATADEQRVRESIAEVATRLGMPVRLFRVERSSLEDLFVRTMDEAAREHDGATQGARP